MRVFVYGTLMRGEANHRLLRGSQFVGAAKTVRGFCLFDHGPFPAMVRMGDGVVSGEVFEIREGVLGALDRLEGYPTLYGRELIDLDDGSQAIAYVQNGERVRGRPRIDGGDWRLREDKDLRLW